MFHIHRHNNIKYFERVVLKKLTRFLFPKIFLIQHVLHLHSRRKNNASNVKTVIKDPRKILSQNEDIKFPSNFFSKKRVPSVLFSISRELDIEERLSKRGSANPSATSLMNIHHSSTRILSKPNKKLALESESFLFLLPAIDNNYYYCGPFTRLAIFHYDRLKSLCNECCETRPILEAWRKSRWPIHGSA